LTSSWDGIAGLLAMRKRLHDWARADERVIAAVAFGSTERSDRPADAWSDLDLLFLVDQASPWFDDLSWVDAIGRSWLRLVNDAPVPGVRVVQVLFEGGYDADLLPIDAAALEVVLDPMVAAEVFGHGARVVVDRTGAFGNLAGPDGTVAIAPEASVRPPTREAFDHVVATFLYQTVWATKRLSRGELWRAHDDVDDYMRDRLLTMLEWHALARGVDGVYPESRKLEAWVPRDVADELPDTFATYDAESVGRALPAGQTLFRRLAREVASHWGLEYPDPADAAIERWVAERLAERS
jgi:aminoglycoside 6-adenylyltransferase